MAYVITNEKILSGTMPTACKHEKRPLRSCSFMTGHEDNRVELCQNNVYYSLVDYQLNLEKGYFMLVAILVQSH